MTAGALLTLGVGLAVAAVVAGPEAALAGGPLLAAHRGGSLLWPENSLLAFSNAIALGVDFLEFDVHLSRDGEAVVIHDPILERTTTGRGAVRDLTLAELRTLRLRDRAGHAADETLPALDEVVRLAAPSPVRLLLEIKADVRGGRYPGIEETVLRILDRHGMTGRTILTSFEQETLRRLRTLRPEVTVGGLYRKRNLAERRSTTLARELDAQRELGASFVGLHQELITPEVVAQAERAGLLLGVWTVNDPGALKRFVALGVGVLITDRPDLAKELLGR